MQQMYRFGINRMFRSGNIAVTSKLKLKVTASKSKDGGTDRQTDTGGYDNTPSAKFGRGVKTGINTRDEQIIRLKSENQRFF